MSETIPFPESPESQTQLIEERDRQAFLLSRCPEWQLTVDEDMLTSVEVLKTGHDPHAEEKRVISSLYSLQYLKDGFIDSYKDLVGIKHEYDEHGNVVTRNVGQKPEGRLRWDQFSDLHQGLLEAMPDDESFDAMKYIMLLHDIGKNPKIMRTVGLDPKTGNHDEALRLLFTDEFAEQRSQLLPTYASDRIFSERQKELIAGVLRLPVNWPGLMQSQSTAAELNNIPANIDPQVLKMSFWHGLLDIAGVAGHIKPTLSLALTEQTADATLDAAAAFLSEPEYFGLPEGALLSGQMRNTAYLMLRARRYGVDLESAFAAIQDPMHDAEQANARYEYIMEHLDQTADPAFLRHLHAEFPIPSLKYQALRAKVIFANMSRAGKPEDFQSISDSYDDLPLFAHINLGVLLDEADDIQQTMELDYGPSLLRTLRSHPVHAKHALRYMEHVLSMAASASVTPATLEAYRSRTPKNFTVALRQLAIDAAKADFDPTTAPIVASLLQGDTIVPTVDPNPKPSTDRSHWPYIPGLLEDL